MRKRKPVVDRKRLSMADYEARMAEAKALDVASSGRKVSWTWKGKA